MNYIEAASVLMLKFVSMLVLVLLPVRPVMVAVGVLVLADMVTGIWASLKEGKSITSGGLKKTVAKGLAYQMAIIVAFTMETWLLEGVPLVKVCAGLIALTEGASFFENMHRITGVNFWALLLEKIHGGSIKLMPDDKKDEPK